jgi:hypothetical protein
MKQTIKTSDDTIFKFNKQIAKNGKKYILIIPKPLIDGGVLDTETFYEFTVRKAEVITEGVKESKDRIRKEKRKLK